MQIEEGKYYRTRDGRKAGPIRIADIIENGPWQADLDDGSNWCFDSDGTLTNFHSGKPEDLIAEWTDGPVRTETVTTRRIVPGVYGRVRVSEVVAYDPVRKVIGLEWVDRNGNEAEGGAAMSATELDDLAMVASQLAEALRDGLD